jgi:hypothetical protein
MRSITGGQLTKATTRISCPHRGHSSGSTSKMRRSSSAHRRRTSRGGTTTGSAQGHQYKQYSPAAKRRGSAPSLATPRPFHGVHVDVFHSQFVAVEAQ